MKRAGFTLVEMLIVVVIIWILSSALLPRLIGYMARTRDMKRQADLRNIAAAIEMYRGEIGEWPLLTMYDLPQNRENYLPRILLLFLKILLREQLLMFGLRNLVIIGELAYLT